MTFSKTFHIDYYWNCFFVTTLIAEHFQFCLNMGLFVIVHFHSETLLINFSAIFDHSTSSSPQPLAVFTKINAARVQVKQMYAALCSSLHISIRPKTQSCAVVCYFYLIMYIWLRTNNWIWLQLDITNMPNVSHDLKF